MCLVLWRGDLLCLMVGAPPSVRVACGLNRLKYVFLRLDLRLDGQRKGSRGYHERFVGTCRVFNEVIPARRLQLAAARYTEQHQNLDGGSFRW